MGNRRTAEKNGRKNRGRRNGGKGQRPGKEEFSFSSFLREELLEVYLVIMLAVYPLFMADGYRDLVYRKWGLLLYASALFLAGSAAAAVPAVIRLLREKKRPVFSVTDGFVLLYLVCVLISFAGAADRKGAVMGVPTWYMGLVAQLLFVGIYFAVSRGCVRLGYLRYLTAAVFLILCGMVILQRFGVDVLSLYADLPEEVKLNFVATMGQVTWSSSYISILLIAGIGIYYCSAGGRDKYFMGCCLAAGFATEAVLNCDSGMIAAACAMLLLLWFSLAQRERLMAFLEIVMIAAASFGGTGILERIFKKRMVPIDAVYLYAAQSAVPYVILAAAAVLYLLLRFGVLSMDGEKRKVSIARGIYAGFLVLLALAAALLFVLHGKGYFAGSPTENYFRFTVWWGNSRGFIWRVGAAVFQDFNVFRKLFGCGPDGFTAYAYGLMGDAINEFWSNQTVPNVHNEWFNAVINYGLAGGAAYLGIFVTAAKRFLVFGLRAAGERPELFGMGLAAAGYIAHNLLCYQQMIGTPLIFLLLGLGEAAFRDQTSSRFLK